MSKFNYYHGGSAARKNFSGAGGGVSLDYKFKISNADTTPNFAENKIVAGANVTLTKNNAGANETITISTPTPTTLDYKTKISSADSTPNFVENKIVAGSNITITKNNTGANESLTIAATAQPTSQKDYTFNFGTGLAIAAGVFLVPGTAASSFPTNGMGFYIPAACTIKDLSICLDKVLTFGTSESITFKIRKITADGSRSTEIARTSGTELASVTLTGKNTAGAYVYYWGAAATNLNVALVAGDMIFLVCDASTINACTGASATIQIST